MASFVTFLPRQSGGERGFLYHYKIEVSLYLRQTSAAGKHLLCLP